MAEIWLVAAGEAQHIIKPLRRHSRRHHHQHSLPTTHSLPRRLPCYPSLRYAPVDLLLVRLESCARQRDRPYYSLMCKLRMNSSSSAIRFRISNADAALQALSERMVHRSLRCSRATNPSVIRAWSCLLRRSRASIPTNGSPVDFEICNPI